MALNILIGTRLLAFAFDEKIQVNTVHGCSHNMASAKKTDFNVVMKVVREGSSSHCTLAANSKLYFK